MLLSDLPTCKKVAICRSSRTSGSTRFPGLGIARAACAATSCNAGSFSSSFWSSSAVNLSGCQDTFQEKSASRLQHFNLFTLFHALLAEHFTATQGRLPQSSCQSHVLQKGAEKLHMLLQVLPATSTSGKDIQILHMESSSAEEHHISHISWFSTQPVSLHLW